MEIVNLVQIRIQRLGTASGHGPGFGSLFENVVEAQDLSDAGLRKLVIEQAEIQGDRGPWDLLKKVPNGNHQTVTFDIHTGSTSYSSAYAVCKAFPALKSNDGRYFKLEEVK